MTPLWKIPFATLSAVGGVAAPASACSTCFGDPDSAMVKGAVMGVYVMVGVVGFVLAGIAGTGLYWIQRSRRLSRQAGEFGAERDGGAPPD